MRLNRIQKNCENQREAWNFGAKFFVSFFVLLNFYSHNWCNGLHLLPHIWMTDVSGEQHITKHLKWSWNSTLVMAVVARPSKLTSQLILRLDDCLIIMDLLIWWLTFHNSWMTSENPSLGNTISYYPSLAWKIILAGFNRLLQLW